jgi:hypothetical protein
MLTMTLRRLEMNENQKRSGSGCLRRLAVAVTACGAVAAPIAFAHPLSNLILVPPADLPELAQQSGEAMLLQGRLDGRTLLYIEQSQGAGIAVFDVTDPGHVKAEGATYLDAPGPFDFVIPLRRDSELIRFRQDQGEAVLDLHKVWFPSLKRVQALTFQGPITRLGDDGFIATNKVDSISPPTLDYQVVDTANLQSLNLVFDVKRVREALTDNSTGTTFLLTENGLYLIRRPAVEMEKRNRELESTG